MYKIFPISKPPTDLTDSPPRQNYFLFPYRHFTTDILGDPGSSRPRKWFQPFNHLDNSIFTDEKFYKPDFPITLKPTFSSIVKPTKSSTLVLDPKINPFDNMVESNLGATKEKLHKKRETTEGEQKNAYNGCYVYDIKLNKNKEELEITRCHRLSRRPSDPVIVEIPEQTIRTKIFRNSGRLRDDRIFISKDYSPKIRNQKRILNAKRKELSERGTKAKLRDKRLLVNGVSYQRSEIFLERSIYSQKKVTPSADIDIKDWFIFYKKLLNKGDNEPFHKANLMIRWEDIELDKEITLDEFKAKIKTLRDGKAAGPDNIPKELLKKLPIPILEKLRTIFNKIMITKKYPEIWTNSIIHPIFKNGDRNNPSDYRGIALCSNMSKLFTQILRNRFNIWIEKKYYIGENQEGFRKNLSCLDHIFTLNTLIQLSLRKKRGKL
ncbi:hypothetical protein LAZ67_3001184 [Cordylochernes scorpioides]|uniref:Reverse transcriptase domain-containing protein n=1 Tax=Cordylochernes scorpioides TaxID=51811 RepID=A0ABY6K8H1_9ARAC|nr:hypothetical protein LAZ67_3001184 [Cordylochernes scorpioides]